MKNFRLFFWGVCALFAASCARDARISGSIAQAPDSQVIVKLLDVNVYRILDTVATDSKGRFSYKLDVREAEPEFIYIFYKDTKVASLILKSGDRVSVESDTLGVYSVKGSDESEKLRTVELNYSEFMSDCRGIISGLEDGASQETVRDANRRLSRCYVNYYRQALKFVIENKGSLSAVPVLYQNINADLPVFNRESDAVYFRCVCDSLKTLYPSSRYVKALEKETVRRENLMAVRSKLQDASQTGCPDIVMTDVRGNRQTLSALDSKVILLHFWTASDSAQKMFNLDFLKPVYDKFNGRGFQIFSVAVDTDKSTWASATKNLPWINVCDGLGASSPVVMTYALSQIPVSYLIVDGEIVPDSLSDRASLEKAIAKYLE